MFPSTTIAEFQRMSEQAMRHTCTITDPAQSSGWNGSDTPPIQLYSGACHVTDDYAVVERLFGGDASGGGDAVVRLPATASFSTGLPTPNKTEITTTFEGLTRKGIVTAVKQREIGLYLAIRWTEIGQYS